MYTFIVVLCLLISSLVSITYADELIYDNSTLTGYGYNTYNTTWDELNEFVDFGESSGGRVSKFVFDYYTNSSATGILYVKFYDGTDDSSVGSLIESFAFIPSDTDGYLDSYTYIIPEDERFDLPNGYFGYSFQTTSQATYIALASGGQSNEDFLWEHLTWLGYAQPVGFSNSWSGFSMKVYRSRRAFYR
jgi:hypothetical protein